MFKKFLIGFGFVLVFVFVIFVLSTPVAQARQGCCSGYFGVCGCLCCDGKPLSDVCVKYYPECDSKAEEKPLPPALLAAGAGEVKINNSWWISIFALAGLGAIAFLAKLK